MICSVDPAGFLRPPPPKPASPVTKHSSGGPEDVLGLRICRLFQEYTRRWDRDRNTENCLPLWGNLTQLLMYTVETTVAERVFCAVTPTQRKNMAPLLNFKDKIPRRNKTEEGEIRRPLPGQGRRPGVWKGVGPGEPGASPRQCALPGPPPAPGPLSSHSRQAGAQGLRKIPATLPKKWGHLKAVSIPSKQTCDSSKRPPLGRDREPPTKAQTQVWIRTPQGPLKFGARPPWMEEWCPEGIKMLQSLKLTVCVVYS